MMFMAQLYREGHSLSRALQEIRLTAIIAQIRAGSAPSKNVRRKRGGRNPGRSSP
jgi:hypothetical protein